MSFSERERYPAARGLAWDGPVDKIGVQVVCLQILEGLLELGQNSFLATIHFVAPNLTTIAARFTAYMCSACHPDCLELL
jgi:hypothetical protein